MKLCIITYNVLNNYGGTLQAYALQTILRRMGHNVYVARTKPKAMLKWYVAPYIIAIRIYNIIRNRGKGVLFPERKSNREFQILFKNTWPFITRHINLYYVDRSYIVPKGVFDCLVVGSDQVWRPKLVGRVKRMFLDYAEGWDIKRIAYAASFGIDEWSEYTPALTNKVARLAKKFDAISVREESGVKLCKEHLGVDAEWLLDPTMLLSVDDYKALINEELPQNNPEGKICHYVLDVNDDNTNIYNIIVEDLGLPKYRMIGDVFRVQGPVENRVLPSFSSWLNMFDKSKFIYTDSFHGTVFSIIFNVPFVVYGNKFRGLARIQSLLKMFGLEDRLISSVDGYNAIKGKSINWQKVNSIRENMRLKSELFLKTALNY